MCVNFVEYESLDTPMTSPDASFSPTNLRVEEGTETAASESREKGTSPASAHDEGAHSADEEEKKLGQGIPNGTQDEL